MMATTRATPAELAGWPRLGELPQTLTLEVTRLDLFFGIRESGNQCPIAHAFRRALVETGADVLTVDVDDTLASVWLRDKPERWTTYRHDAAAFVRSFDERQGVEPCTVTLTLWGAS